MIVDRPQFQIRTAHGVVNRFPWDVNTECDRRTKDQITKAEAHKAAIRALGAWSAAPIWGGKPVTMVEVKP